MLKMKNLKRAMLGAVTFFCPVFLAACYGPPNREWEDPTLYDLSGTVVDSATQAPIPDIGVLCQVGTEYSGQTNTDQDGNYLLIGGKRCDAVEFTDPDGEENGGLFENKIIVTSELSDGDIVELIKLTPSP